MKIMLRWRCRDDILELEKANQALWKSNFPFLHYFESFADSSFEKYLEILLLIDRGAQA